MILFQSVTKRYDEHMVLNNIELQIGGGEFVTLIGPSGAGKSTLIHALIGATSIDRGSITVDGHDITKFTREQLQNYRRGIGMVFQDFKLLPKKTVYENVAFAMEVCGENEDVIRKRVKEVLEMVGLQNKNGNFPNQLSGGEKQKTAVARALVHNPKLFIADEPTGNLDPESSIEILNLLQKIHINGSTVILATHNKHLVDRLMKRVVVMRSGSIVDDREESGYGMPKAIEEVERVELE